MSESVHYGNDNYFHSKETVNSHSGNIQRKIMFQNNNNRNIKVGQITETTLQTSVKGDIVEKSSTVLNLDSKQLHQDAKELEEDSDRITAMSKWRNFTSGTTFHGIKYIFEDAHCSVRRLVWILCVIAAISAFVWQVGARSLAFLQRHSNVNVQTIYTDDSRLALPAITICNQNSFRISESSIMGVYTSIDAYFSRNDKHDTSFDIKDFKGINPEALLTATAHQQDDLIERCTWQGISCSDITNATFTRIISDLGVCYTFNNQYPPLNVSGAGSAMGLSLILNVEQYEYMKGRSGDAGVKIMVHDAAEVPLMSDLGFSTAPGTHTYAAIKRSEVYNLPYPYGKCIEDAVPKSVCIIEERAKRMEELCGCIGPDFKTHLRDRFSQCNISRALSCVLPYTDNPKIAAAGQKCAVPCHRVLYDASLSYAQLSKSNIQSAVLRDTPNRLHHIQSKLLNATEISERMSKSSNSSNQKMVSEMVEILDSVYSLINESSIIYSSTDYMTKHFGVGDIAEHGADTIKALILTYTYQRLMLIKFTDALCLAVHTSNLGDITRQVYELIQYLAGNTNNQTSNLRNMTDVCDAVVNKELIDYFLFEEIHLNSSSVLVNSSTGLIINPLDSNLFHCVTSISDIRTRIQNVVGKKIETYANCSLFGYQYQSTILQNSLMMYPYLYEAKMKMWYHETPIDPVKDIPEYLECQRYLEQAAEQNEFFLFDQLIQSLNDVSLSTNYTGLKNDIANIDSQRRRMTAFQEGFLDQLFDACSWIKIYNFYLSSRFYQDEFSQPEYVKFYDFRYIRLEQLTENFPQLKRQFDDNTAILSEVKHYYETIYRSWTDALTNYIRGGQSKLYLATFVTNTSTEKGIASFTRALENYESSGTQLQNVASSICSDLKMFMKIYFDFRIPFLNNTMMLKTDLFLKIFSRSTDPQALIAIQNLTQRHSYHTQNLVQISCRPFTNYITRDRLLLEAEADLLMSKIADMRRIMTEYKDSVKVNTKFYMDNFLQVDLFYKELSYERVDQQVAFEALSLFSEVGGFMGLLLGASLLTLCELCDFLISIFCLKLQRSESKPRDNSKLQV